MARPRLNGRRRLLPAGVRWQLARSDDSGATLIFALIFITVVAVMIAAVLSFVDTSMRTTVAVRSEAAKAAAADGAAQVAINYIRTNDFITGGAGTCVDGMSPLGDFYQEAGIHYSASVTCAPDDIDSVAGGAGGGLSITSSNRPGQAVLTDGLGSNDGFDVYPRGNLTMQVQGEIRSNSYITVQKNLRSTANISAVGNCVALSGGTIQSTGGTVQCNLGGGGWADPGYDKPAESGPLVTRTLPTCTGGTRVYDFLPGVYTDGAALSSYTSSTNSCKNSVLWFHPGTYYFNFSLPWSIDSGTVVGGTPTSTLSVSPAPTLPFSCETPIDEGQPGWTKPSANAGVEFVLGGQSRIDLGAGRMELCGTYHTDAPPIALYVLTHPAGTPPGPIVPAATGKFCANEIGDSSNSNNGGSCATLFSDKSPNSTLYVQGTTYAPSAWVDIDINNNSGQVFRFGIISRKLSLIATASSDLSKPIIEVPNLVYSGPSLTVLYLAVFVCTGTTPCSTSGTPQLKVKVGITDPDGTVTAGKRQVTVYDWSGPS
jgi:hypothetical protein